MALTAIDSRNGNVVESFQLTDEQWQLMKAQPPGTYRMRRTNVPAVLKQNVQGTKWFAYPPGHREPGGKPESAEHIFIKLRLVQALRVAGIPARVEEPGQTPDGEKWEADVYMEPDGLPIALEVQVSPQSLDEYRRRSDRYRRSNVRVAWLINRAHWEQFTLACAYSNGWAQGSPTMRYIHRVDVPGFAFTMRFPRGQPSYDGIAVEVFTPDVWPPLQLRLDEFAVGLAKGALLFSKEARLWTWREQRNLDF